MFYFDRGSGLRDAGILKLHITLKYCKITNMINYEPNSYGEFEADKSVYRDLLYQMTFLIDDAFEAQRLVGYGKDDVAEFMQEDTHSYIKPLYSVLLTESGDKSDIGTEEIRVLAEPRYKDMSIEEAAIKMYEADGLVYNTEQFFVVHKFIGGDKRYCRADDSGIYPWQPKLQDIFIDDGINLNIDFTIEEFLPKIITAEQKQLESNLERLDIAYAKELIDKLDQWSITTQN